MIAPIIVTESPAGAADMEAVTKTPLTFIDLNGNGVTCAVDNFAHHNTDDPNQPYVDAEIAFDGGTECQNTRIQIVLTYKDKSGVTRTSYGTGQGPSSVAVYGAYGPITTTVSAVFLSCDSARSASCQASATASPK